MVVVKTVFILFIGIYALYKITNGVNNQQTTSVDKIVNLIEIVVSVLLTFFIFKI